MARTTYKMSKSTKNLPCTLCVKEGKNDIATWQFDVTVFNGKRKGFLHCDRHSSELEKDFQSQNAKKLVEETGDGNKENNNNNTNNMQCTSASQPKQQLPKQPTISGSMIASIFRQGSPQGVLFIEKRCFPNFQQQILSILEQYPDSKKVYLLGGSITSDALLFPVDCVRAFVFKADAIFFGKERWLFEWEKDFTKATAVSLTEIGLEFRDMCEGGRVEALCLAGGGRDTSILKVDKEKVAGQQLTLAYKKLSPHCQAVISILPVGASMQKGKLGNPHHLATKVLNKDSNQHTHKSTHFMMDAECEIFCVKTLALHPKRARTESDQPTHVAGPPTSLPSTAAGPPSPSSSVAGGPPSSPPSVAAGCSSSHSSVGPPPPVGVGTHSATNPSSSSVAEPATFNGACVLFTEGDGFGNQNVEPASSKKLTANHNHSLSHLCRWSFILVGQSVGPSTILLE